MARGNLLLFSESCLRRCPSVHLIHADEQQFPHPNSRMLGLRGGHKPMRPFFLPHPSLNFLVRLRPHHAEHRARTRESVVPCPSTSATFTSSNLPASCMAVASRNWTASWTSEGWASRREARAWSLGRRLLVVCFMLTPGLRSRAYPNYLVPSVSYAHAPISRFFVPTASQ